MEDEKHTHDYMRVICNNVHIIFQYKTKSRELYPQLVAFEFNMFFYLFFFFLPTYHFFIAHLRFFWGSTTNKELFGYFYKRSNFCLNIEWA